ncbi:MAG: hypothetical protein IT581_10840 [Verrucomicrobiales bacterium]|nr:hypothetical protein [Verrucomicrobiales bacterium]
MNFPDAQELKAAGFLLVPLSTEGHAGLRVAAVLRNASSAERPAGFVTVRDFFSGRAVLGAWIDAGGAVHDWLEIWIQSLSDLAESPNQSVQRTSCLEWDRRWVQFFEASKRIGTFRPFEIGYESQHPLPLFYRPSTNTLSSPVEPASGQPWELVTDDSFLESRGLPQYSKSLIRFFAVQDSPDRAMTTAGPSEAVPEGVIPWNAAVQDAESLIPLNAEAGLMQVHRLARLSLDAWIDVVNGERDEREVRDELTEVPGLSVRLGEIPGGTPLFMAERSASQNALLEVLYAKLQIFRGILVSVYTVTRRTKQPFLNLGASSFRVGIDIGKSGLPLLWTCEAKLVKPSGAGFLPIGDGQRQVPVPLGIEGRDAAYLPENLAFERPEGRGDIRLLEQKVDNDTVQLKVVIRTATDLFDVVVGDFCMFTLRLGGKRAWFHGSVAKSLPNPMRGQLEIATPPQRLDLVQLDALRRSGANTFLAEFFQVFPNLGSPCDLHSLGVLLVRILFGNQSRDFRDAVRDVHRLMSRLASLVEDSTSEALMAGIRQVFQEQSPGEEGAWKERLGGAMVAPWGADAEAHGTSALPVWLWQECLAFLVRLFPKQGPFSWCEDYAGPPAEDLSGIFEGPIIGLGALLERIRSLLLGDLRHEADMGSIVRELHNRLKGTH